MTPVGEQDALARALARIEQLEEELRADTPRRLLFEQALDLMCVAGPDGYFKELNAAWTKVLGFSVDELMAVPLVQFVHPEDQAQMRLAAARLKEGETVTALHIRYRHQNGSYRWLSWNAVFDRRTMRIYAVGRDITDTIATRRALEASEAAYTQLFNGMLDGFSFHDMIFDEQGEPIDYRFLAVNPAFEEMTGFKASDLVGRRVLDVLPATEKHWIEVFGNVAKTGIPMRYENYSQAFDKWFEVLAFCPQRGQFACTFHDITARKRAEAARAQLQAQVEHAQKLESLGMMAGGIAHDFNNLLTAIMNGIELASADASRNPERARENLALAMRASESAADLCRQMLAYAGRAESRKEMTDLTALTRDILPLTAPSLGKKLRVLTEFSDAPLRVIGDRSQLRQVVLNLVLNAGDAIGDREGTIRVRTGVRSFSDDELAQFQDSGPLQAGSYAFVEITDTGSGMTKETISRIFEPFFTTKFAGRGLGLAATQGIVRTHGGGIHVESTPGVGSRFLVALPEAAADAVTLTSRPGEKASWAASGTILLCDDDPSVRRVTAHLVNSLGFDVLEASDGREALDFFAKRSGELRAVLLDMTMPKMSGLEVLPLLRQQRADVPVVLMSGYDENRLAAHLQDGRVTFLSKPFRREELRGALQSVLTGN